MVSITVFERNTAIKGKGHIAVLKNMKSYIAVQREFKMKVFILNRFLFFYKKMFEDQNYFLPQLRQAKVCV